MTSKLLLLGIDTATPYILDYAKRIGVVSIITDYQDPRDAPLKLEADEYWMIDLSDLDQLETKCKETGVTAVMGGNHEFCLDKAKELCKRLNLPFYSSDSTWEIVRNKGLIKEQFQIVGLHVPKRYSLDERFLRADLDAIRYPVIVKPSDNNGERGLSLCGSETELIQGYQKALQFSQNKEIIVEQYIDGDEVNIAYYLEDGRPHLMSISDNLKMEINGRKHIAIAFMHSRFYDECKELTNTQLTRLIKSIGCENGHVFFQAIRENGRYYFLESGYRLSGGCYWALMQKQIKNSYLEWMVDLALGRKPSIQWDEIDSESLTRNCLIYLYWAKAGKIHNIIGADCIKDHPDMIVSYERFKKDSQIAKTDDFTQIAWYIQMLGETKEKLINNLRFVNDHLKLLDENGESLMMPYDDYDYLLEMY